MKQRLTTNWQKLPSPIRKPIILILGGILIIASLLTGWLPGPGGIPLFLLGIAILATEFERAKIVRDKVLSWLKYFSRWFKDNQLLGLILIALFILTLVGLSTLFSYLITNP